MLLPQPPTHTRENEKENENENENENTAWVSVSVHENSIAVFQKELQSEQLYIWVMKEYSVASSWTKEISHQCPVQGMPKPWVYGFSRNDELVLQHHIRWLISWNPDSQKIKNLEISSYNYTFVGSYEESLVLLGKATNRVHIKRK